MTNIKKLSQSYNKDRLVMHNIFQKKPHKIQQLRKSIYINQSNILDYAQIISNSPLSINQRAIILSPSLQKEQSQSNLLNRIKIKTDSKLFREQMLQNREILKGKTRKKQLKIQRKTLKIGCQAQSMRHILADCWMQTQSKQKEKEVWNKLRSTLQAEKKKKQQDKFHKHMINNSKNFKIQSKRTWHQSFSNDQKKQSDVSKRHVTQNSWKKSIFSSIQNQMHKRKQSEENGKDLQTLGALTSYSPKHYNKHLNILALNLQFSIQHTKLFRSQNGQ